MFSKSRDEKLFEEGIAYLRQERYPDAIKAFSEAIEIGGFNIDNSGSYFNRGRAYSYLAEDILAQYSNRDKRVNEYCNLAIKDFTSVISLLTPQSQIAYQVAMNVAKAYFNRANAYFMLEKPNEAIADLSLAIDLNPDDFEYRLKRGFIYIEMVGNADKGIKDCTNSLNLNETALGHVCLAMAYFDLGDLNRAKSEFRKAVYLDPSVKGMSKRFERNKSRKWAEFIATL